MSYFDLLPDEIVIMIVKMVVSDKEKKKHDYVVDVIGNISKRFLRLARDKSLWVGEIWIHGDNMKIRKVIHNFLSDGVTTLYLSGGNGMLHRDIKTIFEICPKCHNVIQS